MQAVLSTNSFNSDNLVHHGAGRKGHVKAINAAQRAVGDKLDK